MLYKKIIKWVPQITPPHTHTPGTPQLSTSLTMCTSHNAHEHIKVLRSLVVKKLVLFCLGHYYINPFNHPILFGQKLYPKGTGVHSTRLRKCCSGKMRCLGYDMKNTLSLSIILYEKMSTDLGARGLNVLAV